jgi:hypothetical protein
LSLEVACAVALAWTTADWSEKKERWPEEPRAIGSPFTD